MERIVIFALKMPASAENGVESWQFQAVAMRHSGTAEQPLMDGCRRIIKKKRLHLSEQAAPSHS